MKEEKAKTITHGSMDLTQLGTAEARAFYATLLVRMLELYRQKREGV